MIADTLWLHLLSRGDAWSSYTSLFGTVTPFGPLDWSQDEAHRTLLRMTRAGVLERRYIVNSRGTAGRGRVRAEYRVPPRVRAMLQTRLATRPQVPPSAPRFAPPPRPPYPITPPGWAAYIAERYGPEAARSLEIS